MTGGPPSPAFTVVLPAFNERVYIADAIGSVLAQSREDFELIVVDDGSSDETGEIAETFTVDPRVRVLRQENAGLSAARNTGVREASAPLVSFLDGDDLWMPGYLEAMGTTLEQHPDADLAYCDAWWVDVETGRFNRRSAMSMNHPPSDPPRDPGEFANLLLRANFIFVSTTVRRRALEAAGPFDTGLTACEDYEMWIRILAAGGGAVSAGGRLAIKRDRLTSMSRSHINMHRNLREVCERAAHYDGLPDTARQIAAERARGLAHVLSRLERGSRIDAVRIAARAAAGRGFRAAVASRAWLRTPPAEIEAAFPGVDWSRS